MQTVFLASERLADAEATASSDQRRAQRDPDAFRSSIYPLGSEFALCHAESQLMSAVVGVLNESVTESLKGFYKLRKAFITLDAILEAEKKYIQGASGVGISKNRTSLESLRSNRAARSIRDIPGDFGDEAKSTLQNQKPLPRAVKDLKGNALNEPQAKTGTELGSEADDEDEEFYDVDEIQDEARKTETYTGHISLDRSTKSLEDLSIASPNTSKPKASSPLQDSENTLDEDPDSDLFTNPIDVFIHSGSNLCFGLLNLLISMIPPAFNRLLFIIGFHGDRDRGIRMLWQASKFHNINGAMAGLILLGYYNTLISLCDILPDPPADPSAPEALSGHPKERCEALLASMRTRYPSSKLWLLEQARMEASKKRLKQAIALLETSSRSPLKQVNALATFETSLNAMYTHDYSLCSSSFQTCVTLNNWSHALYYYIAGTCHVELYRHHLPTNPTLAATHAAKATALLQKVPEHVGKKKFMSRQLPFDAFVSRKLLKWTARAKENSIPLIDAVGVSPVEEMIFFWNGYKRMSPPDLEHSLRALAWSEAHPTWASAEADERAILAVLRAAVLRNLGREGEAVGELEGVLGVEKGLLKGGLRDDWMAPVAHYEMGVIFWGRRGRGGREGVESVRICGEWVGKAAGWEGYVLDARIGLKVRMATETLKKWDEGRGKGKGEVGEG